MAPRQHDAAMIHLGRRPGALRLTRQLSPLHKRAATCGTPIGLGFLGKHGVAVAANPLHT